MSTSAIAQPWLQATALNDLAKPHKTNTHADDRQKKFEIVKDKTKCVVKGVVGQANVVQSRRLVADMLELF